MRVTCTKCGKFTNGPIDSWVIDGVEQLEGPICITCYNKVKTVEYIKPIEVHRKQGSRGRVGKGYAAYPNAWKVGWFSAVVKLNGRRRVVSVHPTKEEALRIAVDAAKAEGTYNHVESEKYLKKFNYLREK